MDPFIKKYNFELENKEDALRKVKSYFKNYNFKLRENDNNEFIFYKKFSFLQGWIINPLNWESQVIITIQENKLSIKYINEGNAHITPFAFNNLFNSFFKNLELHLNKSVSYELNNQIKIKEAKQKVLLQFLIIIAGVLVFAFLGRFLKQEFNFHLLSKFSIVIGGLLSLKMLNQYWFQKSL